MGLVTDKERANGPLRHRMQGLTINVDNIDELERVHVLRRTLRRHCHSAVGCRVNPGIGSLDPLHAATTSTAEVGSKFGIPLDSRALRDWYARAPWLQSVHLHVGSQGTHVHNMALCVFS